MSKLNTRLTFGSIEDLEQAVRLFFSDQILQDFEIDTADGRSLLVNRKALPRLKELEVQHTAGIHAHEDNGHDGAWVTCPYCNHENGVTWAGLKECTSCDSVFGVVDGPLVKMPTQVG